MKKYIEKEIIKNEKVLEKIICDCCNCEISANNGYYEVTTGNKGEKDSVLKEDICSDKCLKEIFNEFLEYDSYNKWIGIEKK